MIGKISSGGSFGGCVEYALALKEKEKEARLLYAEGLMTDSAKSIIEGFECQSYMNPRVKKCVGHISLSYSPEDSSRLSDENMIGLAQEYLEKMGIKNTQYIISRHLDKEHPHCHIVYNRVDNDGKCINDSFIKLRNKDVCRELKEKYGLTFGKGKDNIKVDRLQGRHKTRQEVYLAVKDALKTCKDWNQFQRELAKSGITVRKKFRKGTTEVQGLSYTKDNHQFKASEVDRDGKCSFRYITRQLEVNRLGESKPKQTAHEPQIRSPASQQKIRVTPQPTHQPSAPSIVEKAVESATEVAANLSAGTSGLFQVGPANDTAEQEFYYEMQRRKKKKKGIRL